jgi:hypothetical protein
VGASEQCPAGGVRIDVGLDNDPTDGSLSENEIDDSELICDVPATCQAGTCLVLQNSDFAAGLDNWSAANNPVNGSDTESTFAVTDGRVRDVPSFGPSARTLVQGFTVPASVSAATFNMDFAQDNSSALTPATVQTIEKGGTNGNAFRVDIIAAGGDVFTNPILFELFAPTEATGVVGGVMTPISADASALTTFLGSHLGQTLVLRFAHVESSFPWIAEFDNVALSIAP